MKGKIKECMEPDRKVRSAEIVILIMLAAVSVSAYISGALQLNRDPGTARFAGEAVMFRNDDYDCDEDSKVCEIIYENEDGRLILSRPHEDSAEERINAYAYSTQEGTILYFDHMNPDAREIRTAYRQIMAEQLMPRFNTANALAVLAAGFAVMLLFGAFFTAYEKCWFLSIMTLAVIISVIFPEESANGVSGIWIMLLYLLDTFLNILCELLISKQSRYNFLVSVAVEITEIAISLVLMYRFATMIVTLLFWLPIDIISFINWTRHRDEQNDELTMVRRLKGWQEILVIIAITLWTAAVGWLMSGLDISTDFLGGNRNLEILMIYLDACASAVGIANGLFIFFRMREQWIAWYICAALEAVMNILAGQYVLLVLKLGYFTNTTYGYIRWSRYIRTHAEETGSLF
ncbi:MAG: nicotinamide mononucleotide transporter [Solobacterium sp.]|nr:nicotinamide mononucleotide transporter [Solobacterium sp.]